MTPLMPSCPGARVGFTSLLWTDVKISTSTRRGILSPKASMIVSSTSISVIALVNRQAESTWPCSIRVTLAPCLGTTFVVGLFSKTRSHRNGLLSGSLAFFVLLVTLLPIRLWFDNLLKCDKPPACEAHEEFPPTPIPLEVDIVELGPAFVALDLPKTYDISLSTDRG